MLGSFSKWLVGQTYEGQRVGVWTRIVRNQAAHQVKCLKTKAPLQGGASIETSFGGYGWTRTTDPSIMSAVL
jgi:hypothetical protein